MNEQTHDPSDTEHPQPAETRAGPIKLSNGLTLVPTDEPNVYMDPTNGELYTREGQQLGRIGIVPEYPPADRT